MKLCFDNVIDIIPEIIHMTSIRLSANPLLRIIRYDDNLLISLSKYMTYQNKV